MQIRSNHFFKRCQNFSCQITVLFNDPNANNLQILKMSENDVVRVLLFTSKGYYAPRDVKVDERLFLLQDFRLIDLLKVNST